MAKQETEAEITNKDRVLDTDAYNHFCANRSQFESLKPYAQNIELADCKIVISEGIGTVDLRTKRSSVLRLRTVIYAPVLQLNLLSGFELHEHGYRLEMDENCCIHNRKNRRMIADLSPKNNLFFVDLANSNSTDPMMTAAGSRIICWNFTLECNFGSEHWRMRVLALRSFWIQSLYLFH
jgi:hypothetical protein